MSTSEVLQGCKDHLSEPGYHDPALIPREVSEDAGMLLRLVNQSDTDTEIRIRAG